MEKRFVLEALTAHSAIRVKSDECPPVNAEVTPRSHVASVADTIVREASVEASGDVTKFIAASRLALEHLSAAAGALDDGTFVDAVSSFGRLSQQLVDACAKAFALALERSGWRAALSRILARGESGDESQNDDAADVQSTAGALLAVQAWVARRSATFAAHGICVQLSPQSAQMSPEIWSKLLAPSPIDEAVCPWPVAMLCEPLMLLRRETGRWSAECALQLAHAILWDQCECPLFSALTRGKLEAASLGIRHGGNPQLTAILIRALAISAGREVQVASLDKVAGNSNLLSLAEGSTKADATDPFVQTTLRIRDEASLADSAIRHAWKSRNFPTALCPDNVFMTAIQSTPVGARSMCLSESFFVWSAWHDSAAATTLAEAIMTGEGLDGAEKVVARVLREAICAVFERNGAASLALEAARAAAAAALIATCTQALKTLSLQAAFAPLRGPASCSRDSALHLRNITGRADRVQAAAGCVEVNDAFMSREKVRELAGLVRALIVGPSAFDPSACAEAAVANVWAKFASAAVRCVRVALWGLASQELSREDLFNGGRGDVADELLLAAHCILAAVAAGAALLSEDEDFSSIKFILALVGAGSCDAPWSKHLTALALNATSAYR